MTRLSDVVSAWSERDHRYAFWRARTMTPEQVEAVRVWRLREAAEVDVADRAEALVRARSWQPPGSRRA